MNGYEAQTRRMLLNPLLMAAGRGIQNRAQAGIEIAVGGRCGAGGSHVKKL